MAKITSLDKFKKQQRKRVGKASTLCNSGFHKWKPDNTKRFDVKQGKLVTRYFCQRCGDIKTTTE